MILKRCNLCGKEKPTTEFYPSEFTLDKLKYECIECWKSNYLRSEKLIKEVIKKQLIRKAKEPKEKEEVEGEPLDLVERFNRKSMYFDFS